ncbi:MAG TPA: NDP-sugar synthase [bacterium]|nr:NDP-sugar synthase [bacterium]
MKALLLLGGMGTRLRPFTFATPKPLLPVANIPLVWYQFAILKKYGIDEVVLGVGYKIGDFKKVMSIGKEMGLKMTLSVENKPLGTGGGIRNALKFFSRTKDPFLVFNGDILADFNLQKIIDYHAEKSSSVTIGLVKVANPSSFGLVIAGEGMKVQKFIEKPSQQEVVSDTVNAGVYIFDSPEQIKEIPEGREISLEREIFPLMVEQGKAVFGYVHYGYWLDIGTIESYRKANFDILSGKFNPDYIPKINGSGCDDIVKEGNLALGKNAFIGEGTVIKGNVIIGNDCFVGPNCVLQDTIILDNSAVKNNSAVMNSVIGKEVYIGEYAKVANTVLSDKSLIHSYTQMCM